MRLSKILLLVFVLSFSFDGAYAQTKVTLNLHGSDFEKVIYAIKKQTLYHFVYNQDHLPKKRINLQVKNEEALKVLDDLLENTGFTSTLLQNNLIVISEAHEKLVENTVSGKVLDEYRNALPNATIRIIGSPYGTRSDAEGKFSINLESTQLLKISHVGYISRDCSFKQLEQQPEVVLKTDSNRLHEVVVTALDITKEEKKIGYAVATIKGEELTKAREANFVLGLEGRVAGLNTSGTFAGPSPSSRLLLRGAASMSAGSPLFVLNGIPVDNTQRGSPTEYGGSDYGDGISNLNPDDIQSITILKGSAASALYGARAANGVILISSKTGSKHSPLSVEYNFNLSFDHAVNNTDFQEVYGQGAQNKRPSDLGTAISSGLLSWGEKMDGKPVIQSDGKFYPYSPVKDNADRFYRNAPAVTNTLSASGGGASTTYRLSVSDLNYASILPNSGLNRKTLNLNLSYDLSPRLSFNLNGNYIYERTKNRSYLSDGPLNANYGIEFLPVSANQASLAPGYDPKTGKETPWNNDEYKTNPYFAINKQVNETKRNRFITSATAKYKFSEQLSVQGRFGFDNSDDFLLNVVPTGTAFTVNQQGALNGQKQATTTELNADFLLALNKSLSGDLKLDVFAGGSFRKRRAEVLSYIGSQFIIPYLYIPSNLQSVNSTLEIPKLVTQSVYYTADLSYKHFLNFSTTGRYDIYSTLPSSNRGIFVPGVSGSLVFSELLKWSVLSYGKLRMSFAKTSGEPSLPYTTQTYYSTDFSINGIPVGNFSRSMPNFDLKPFVLNEYEAGVNLIFFNNRLGLDFTYFNRITKNEITNVEQSVTTGFTSSFVNLGKTRNTGVEVMLSGSPVRNKNLSWDLAFNFSHVHNKLVSIDGSSQYILTGKYRPLNANTAMVVGKSITQIMAYDYKRDAEGNIIIDNTGIPERGEFKPMGGTLPTFFGGLSNTFRYRNFSLSFLADFKFGNKVLSASENYSYTYGLNKATLEGRENGVVAKGVREDGTVNTINVPAYTYYPQLASNISALSVLNGSFIKFRQLTLGYTFIPKQARIFKTIAVDLVGRNLFTLLKYTHNIDPESQFSPILNYAGIEGASLPVTRTIGINVNFKFK
ncbi:SusC/RagA family TonB-linked outer membrane protein [Pedobacter nutrimenti]|jgi:TonB-linked SusC/RagA family outer membrane protein|uniref:TonB-linked SusC/RagA family outer membrane protein n=1 Tax=Pedobacter nutrimenti TaxID=1241337 RepID=A0A318UFB8_9SPHI|nr:SusC/RagA family TonB-linked outer membrane protein [Pedobacter nutrimenti]PYF72807.1 TonB-linked SusC/RagA family outer membrane protein [Pedobacter nutrimenti]